MSIDSLIPIQFTNKDKKNVHSKQQNFGHVIRYYSKMFREVDSLVFNQDVSKFVFTPDEPEYLVNSGNENEINVISNNINILNNMKYITENSNNNLNIDKDNIKERLNEFFDITNPDKFNLYQSNSLSLKNFNDIIRYMMDFKVLTEIKEKNIENNKKNENTFKKTIYFRPEFIARYLQEMKQYGGEKENLDSSDAFIRNIKKYLFIDNDGNAPNSQTINNAYKYFRDNHIFFFINCLDSMYFKPYDSPTLSETFHQYGVNMFYLGLVSELTSVPHIRELCMIDMIARTCKKLLFDIMAAKLMEKAFEDYYRDANDQGKDSEYDPITSSEQYLMNVPVTFFLKYNKEYLRKLHLQNQSTYKYMYYDENFKEKKSIKGLYRPFWSKHDSFQESDIKNVFNTGTKVENSGKPDKNTEQITLVEIKKEVVKFFNVLFDFDGEKYEVEILNEKYNHSKLWKLILENVKNYYMIDNKEIFTYFDPFYISLPALFNSIQFHTGIVFNFNIKNNTKFSNNDLKNIDLTDEHITEIRPKTSSYSFRTFSIHKDIEETMKNNYSLMYSKNLHKKVLMRYFTEKFRKSVSVYTWTYFHYMNLLRKMDYPMDDHKDSFVENLAKNDLELKEKFKDLLYYDYFKCKYINIFIYLLF
jgi:hypothetical protein